MNAKTILVAALSCTLPACWGPDATVEISCDEFTAQPAMTREVRLAEGGTLEVALCSNASTGYSWADPEIGDTSKLQSVEHEFESGSGAPGSPGTDVWRFEAREKGSTTVRFTYGESWEGGVKDAWTLVLTTVIE